MTQNTGGRIDTVMHESRLFPPSAEFAAKARIGSAADYQRMWDEAKADPLAFWDRFARELHWFEPYTEVLRWEEPFANWFVGGKTNVSYNCLDIHRDTDRWHKTAIIWEGEPGEVRTLTYAELHREVCRTASIVHSASSKGMSFRSTCRWSPSWRLPCWHVHGSARSIR